MKDTRFIFVSVMFFFFSSRRRHTRFDCDWSSDVCSSDLGARPRPGMTAPTFGRFFLPGPTDVHPDVLAAMQRPMIGHRSSAMERLLQGLEQPLARLFRTSRTVLVGTTSATGVMEMAGRNGVRQPGLSLVKGAFSGTFAKLGGA